MILSSKAVRDFKPLLLFILIMPSIFWLIMFIKGNLGVNPIDILMDKLGEMSLRLIILTLFISSLSKFNILRSLQSIRRMLGLVTFYYVTMHFLTYVALDHFFNWNFILKDIYKRPFITLGFLCFLLLIPLALTSSDTIIKKLTYKIWKKIHYLIYLIAPLAALHFFLLTKADKLESLIYLSIILCLLIWRLYLKISKA
tara:strand:- start:14 stop:610 length:597 start_codon:yes stop_codon:yes gene_type:complete